MKDKINKILFKVIDRIKFALREWRQSKTETLEARRLMTLIDSGAVSSAIIVYDNYVSPPTYGDLLVTLMVGRFLASKKLKVKFIFIDDERRNDWTLLGAETDFADEQLILAKKLLHTFNVDISVMSWSEFLDHSLFLKSSEYVYFKERVLKREAVYCFSFNFMNMVMSNLSKDEVDLVLLSPDTVLNPGSILQRVPQHPYITFGVRKNKMWGVYDTSDDEFLILLNMVLKKFPKHKVVIVSDQHGCTYFKRLLNYSSDYIFFCKDITTSFHEDLTLILNSELHFQLRGGGINTIPMFSRMAYFIVEGLTNERLWSQNQLTSWQCSNQYFQLSIKFDGAAESHFSRFSIA